jgi:hypothetical protein
MGAPLSVVAVICAGVDQMSRLSSIFCLVDAISMTADLAGNREFGASMPRFWPADAKKWANHAKIF